MDINRVLLTVVLSFVLIFAYQELVLKRLYPPQTAASKKINAPDKQTAQAPAVPAAASTTGSIAAPSAAGASAAERTVEVDTDFFDAQFTTIGARLKSFKLKRYRQNPSAQSPLYEMVQTTAGGRLPMGVAMRRGSDMLDDHALAYETSAPDHVEVSGAGEQTVDFVAHTSDGAKIEKHFAFRASTYVFNYDASISPGSQIDALGVSISQPLTALEAFRDIPELQADVADKVITQAEKKLRQGVPPVAGAITYAGFGDRYFLSVFLPATAASGTLAMAFADNEAVARILYDGASHISTRVYMGPKLLEALEAVNPALRSAIDFGWMKIMALALLRTLKLFHMIAPNWGVDILLLTVAIRAATLPLSIRSQRSMMKMQRLQPQMDRLREKLKDNQDQLNKEIMELYKRNHVNPIGGCAPTALQFPVFIGLYEALLNSVELRHAPFIGWINDLSSPDCLPIPWMPQLPLTHCHGLPVLVLLMGALSFVQQYMSPASPDPSQQRMMMLTPLVFTIMLINFPAGLALYYFSSNLLGVIQQYVLNREFSTYTPAT